AFDRASRDRSARRPRTRGGRHGHRAERPERHRGLPGVLMLSLQGVNQYYGESHTLWDLALEVPRGSCTCLMGRNGVGKTTTLKCIMGLLPLQGGEIHFDGSPMSVQSAESRARMGIGYVPQG